jgi:hypothetical protein
MEDRMSHLTDGAEVLALWSNGGLTRRHREKRRCEPRKRAAKGKRISRRQQLISDRSKVEATKRLTS